MPAVEVDIFAGEQKSEFAVFVDGAKVFSRLERRRFPELEDFLEICRTMAV